MTADGYTGNPPGSGGGDGGDIDPSATVVSETSAGQSASAGNATTYSRGNHTHGTPALPTPAAIGASATSHNHTGTYDPAGTATSAVSAHVALSDPHTQYAPEASPALTGTPTAPTASGGTSTTQLATTAFVAAGISGRPLIYSWTGAAYAIDTDAGIYVGPNDPGAVADGSVWIDTTP